MMPPFNTDLIQHHAASLTEPTAHERAAHCSRREARRIAFWAFVEQVFSQMPRHPAPVAPAQMDQHS